MAASKPTLAELQQELKRIQAAIEERRSGAKAELRAEIERMLADAGLTLGEVFPDRARKDHAAPRTRGRNRSEVAAKYKDPATGTLWSGRGRSPKWVEQIMKDRGISVREFKALTDFSA